MIWSCSNLEGALVMSCKTNMMARSVCEGLLGLEAGGGCSRGMPTMRTHVYAHVYTSCGCDMANAMVVELSEEDYQRYVKKRRSLDQHMAHPTVPWTPLRPELLPPTSSASSSHATPSSSYREAPASTMQPPPVPADKNPAQPRCQVTSA